ncbi:MAG: sugar phosphate isomerase/epimerase [Clostridia bacterium]|nr:sugar phosphate isomerase/epimerase [Clostridia bacterium]
MQVGVSTASLFSKLPNEEAVAFFDEQGITLAEVFLTSFCEYSKEFGKLIAQKKGNLQVHSVHVLNTQFEPQLFSTCDRVKADSFEWLKKAMEGAREFGAKCYTFHGIARYKKAARLGINDDFRYWSKCLKEISATCDGYGIELCLENVEWSVFNRPEVFEKISGYYPELKGVLDIKQARISGFALEEYIKVMEGKIAHAHLSDIDANGKICLPGQGIIDFDALFKRLNGAGFDGPAFIEVYKDDYKELSEIKRSVEFLQEKIYKYSYETKKA